MGLTADQTMALWANFMREFSQQRIPLNLTKTELKQAIEAVDAWIDANAASFNAALPAAARSALSAKQKAMLLFYVTMKRFEVS